MDALIVQLGLARATFAAIARLLGVYLLILATKSVADHVEDLVWYGFTANPVNQQARMSLLDALLESFYLSTLIYVVPGAVLLLRARWLSRVFIPRRVMTSCARCGYDVGPLAREK